MEIYWFVILLAFINCLIINKKLSYKIAVLCIVYMSIISGLRAESVGTDSAMYALRYQYTGSANISEFFYSFIITALNNFTNSYACFFLLLSILFYWSVYYVIRKINPDYLRYTVLLLCISNNAYFMESFNAVRQLAASGLLFVTYYYLTEKKYIISSVIYVLALGIHTTCIFFLPLIFAAHLGVKYKWICITLICVNLFAFIFSTYFDISINELLSKFSILDVSRYSDYTDSEKYGHGFNIPGMIKFLLLPSVLCVIVNKIQPQSYFCKLYFWGILFLGLSIPFLNIAQRITQGVLITELIVVPIVLNAHQRKYKLFGYFFVILLSLYFIYMMFTFYALPENLGPYNSSVSVI